MVSSEEIKKRLEEKRKGKEMSSPQKETTPPAVVETATEAPSETVKYCHNCDVEFDGDANFCPDCGSPLENITPAEEETLTEEPEEEYVEEYVEEDSPEFTEEPTGEEPEKSFSPKSMPYTPSTITGDITVVTSNFVPGYKSVKTLGFVYGLTVRSRGLGGQIGAGVRSMFGGEIKEYVKMMEHARQEALTRMIDHARDMGANAVISARFDSDEISDIMQEILAYGTAVIIEKEEKEE